MKQQGYNFIDLSMVNIESTQDVVNYTLEKLWKSLQHLIKIKANYSALETEKLNTIVKKIAAEKEKNPALRPLLWETAFEGNSIERTTDYSRANLLVFLQEVMPYYYLFKLPGDVGGQPLLGINRVFNILMELIRKGNQQCYLNKNALPTPEDKETFIREETKKLTDKLVEDTLEAVLPYTAISKFAKLNINTQATINRLEDLFKDKIEMKKIQKMYQIAVEFAFKHFSRTANPSQTIEQECRKILPSSICSR